MKTATAGLFALLVYIFSTIPPARGADYDEANIRLIFDKPGWVVLNANDLSHYDDIWFVSDIHGRLGKITNFLFQAGLTDKSPDPKWVKRRQLLVLVGDYLDGGSHGAQVMGLLSRLAQEAPDFESKVLVLLGNHEVEFLSDPRPSKMSSETAESFAIWFKVQPKDLQKSYSAANILESIPGKFAAGGYLGAVIGSWLVAHSGDLDTDEVGLPDFIRGLSNTWADKAYLKLFSDDGKGLASLLSRHDWWEKDHERLHQLLTTIGINGLIAGHERKLLGLPQEVAISRGGWFEKIDAGMKVDFEGRMVHCKVTSIQPKTGEGTLLLVDSKGKPNCRQLRASGAFDDITVH